MHIYNNVSANITIEGLQRYILLYNISSFSEAIASGKFQVWRTRVRSIGGLILQPIPTSQVVSPRAMLAAIAIASSLHWSWKDKCKKLHDK